MPPAIGAILAGITAKGIAVAIIKTVLIAGVSKLLQPKQKAGLRTSVEHNSLNAAIMVRQAIVPRRVVFGQRRLSGPMVYVGAVGDENRNLHIALPVAGHRVKAIEDIYFDDKVVPLVGTVPEADTPYDGHARVRKHLGDSNQSADAEMVAEVPEWTTAHRLRGIAYLYTRLLYNEDIYPTQIPNVSAVVLGSDEVYDYRDNTEKYTTNAALCLASYLTNSKFGLRVNRDNINRAAVIEAANASEELVITHIINAVVFTVDTASDVITPTDSIDELVDLNVVRLSTSGALPSPLVVNRNYWAVKNKGENRVQLASSLANAQNRVTINITSGGAGTHRIRKYAELRYTANGIFDMSEAPEVVIKNLIDSMEGSIAWVGGEWFIHAGVYRQPVITLDEDDLVAPVTFPTKQPIRSNFNRVRGIYAGPVNGWQAGDIPPVVNALYLSEDGGEESWLDTEYHFTNSSSAAQRLGKIALEKVRQGITLTLSCKLTAWGIQPGGNFRFKFEPAGWTGSGKVFTCTSMEFYEERKDDGIVIRIRIEARETASGVFDWNNGEETTVDLAPNTNLPNPFFTPAPVNVQLSSGTDELIEKGDGTIASRLKVSWDLPTNLFIGEAQVQYKKVADVEWISLRDVTTDINSVWTFEVADGVEYHARVRFVNNLGIHSEWTLSGDHTVVGKTAAPQPPTGFGITPLMDGIMLTWVNPPDLDFKHVRIVAAGTAAALATPDVDPLSPNNRSIGTADAEEFTEQAAFGTTRYYRIRSEDTSDNFSDWSAVMSGTVGDTDEGGWGRDNTGSATRISSLRFKFGNRIEISQILSDFNSLFFNGVETDVNDRMAITAGSTGTLLAFGPDDAGAARNGFINSEGVVNFRSHFRVGTASLAKAQWDASAGGPFHCPDNFAAFDRGTYNAFEAGVQESVDVRGVNFRIYDAAGNQTFRVDNVDGSIYIGGVLFAGGGGGVGTVAPWAQEGNTDFIPDAKLHQATASQFGVVQRASSQAVNSRTNTEVYMTPFGTNTMIDDLTDSPTHTLSVIQAQIRDRVEDWALEENPLDRIPASKLPNANDTAAGIAFRATSAQARALTNQSRFITPFLLDVAATEHGWGGGGLTQSQVDARIVSWARIGSSPGELIPVAKLPVSSTSQFGTARRATDAQAQNGSSSLYYVTPNQLQLYGGGLSTSEVDARMWAWARSLDLTAIPEFKLPYAILSPTGYGIARRATNTVAQQGTSNGDYVTPFQLANYAGGGGGGLTQSQVDARIASWARIGSSPGELIPIAKLPVSSTTQFGTARRATDAQAAAGSGGIYYVTPAQLKDYVDENAGGGGGSYGDDDVQDYLDVNLRTNGRVFIDGTQVVTNRRTGWGSFLGPLSRQGFNTNLPTASNLTLATCRTAILTLNQRFYGLITDLRSHGLIS